MKKNLLTVISLLFIAGNTLLAQRYLQEVFTSVTTTNDIIYSNNISVLQGPPGAPSDIKMDVYEPTADTAVQRPLVLVFHTGSFLPAVINGQPTGTRKDSAIVEMCKRFAKRGYVAAAVSYRQGWNPLSTLEEVRTGTLINAAYRGVQDAHTCVRYFRKDAATTNTFKIDSNRIAIGGIGTGGYISMAVAYFDKYPELEISKFIDFSQNPPKPFIDTAMSGDFQGLWARPLNTPNHAGYSSAINMIFNCGGALGDLTWLEAGNIPVVAFHCTNDPYAPYTTGPVIVPTTGAFVVEASGSYDVVGRANNSAFGDINNILKQGTYSDVYSARANTINDGYEGLYPFVTPTPSPTIACNLITLPAQEQSAPWDWWDEPTYKATIAAYNSLGYTDQDPDTMACNAKRGNPDMSANKGRTYIDTIQGYLAQRMVNVLGLPGSNVGINETVSNRNISVYPNPSNDLVNIFSNGQLLKSVEIFNVTGQLIRKETGINSSNYQISKKYLGEGIYIFKVVTGNGSSINKVVIY